ncbi:MAG: hypothetical protein KH936_04580 [Neisseria sp.]|nr:hypothetical protein [Neisseria sp.]MDU4437777.1 hypothetical protein [Neisseria sp.]
MVKKFDPMYENQAKALTVQKHQLRQADLHLGKLQEKIGLVNEDVNSALEKIDNLFLQLEQVNQSDLMLEYSDEELFLVEAGSYQPYQSKYTDLEEIQSVGAAENWEEYLEKVEFYAKNHSIEFNDNTFNKLLSDSEKVQFEKWVKDEFTIKGANCDKYDYLIGGTCGLIGGLIDIFLVGSPGSGLLTNFADNVVDRAVMKFAKLNGWSVKEGKEETINKAIGFLEKKFSINYDHRHSADVGNLFQMSTKNHHIKSLGHSPDLLGLFFSILNQFTNTASFVDNGKIITIDTNKYSTTGEVFELQGKTVPAKIFSGFCNWLGHLFSDVAGSSGSRGNDTGRGSGIPMPFYSMLQFCNFGAVGPDKQTFATIAVRVFQEGYDFRHGVALAIPVMITELLTRLMWVVKRRFYHQAEWRGCIPSSNNPELRRMLLIAHGTLCLCDVADAGIRTCITGGNIIVFLKHTNFVAWIRLGTIALKEIPSWSAVGKIDHDLANQYLDQEYKRLLLTV